MIGGFALIAYPAEYGNSGVMTFLVNHAGTVYQKDLGNTHRGHRQAHHACSIRTRPGRRSMRRLLERRRVEAMSWLVRIAVVALLAVVLPATSSFAQASGYVRVKLLKAGLMVGAGGGSGVLTYRGRDYPFRSIRSQPGRYGWSIGQPVGGNGRQASGKSPTSPAPTAPSGAAAPSLAASEAFNWAMKRA